MRRQRARLRRPRTVARRWVAPAWVRAPAPAALVPLAGAAGCFASAAGVFAAGGWLNAAVALAPACGPLFTAIPAAERLAAGNIIVLPASSGAGGAAGPDGTAFAGWGSG